MNRFLKKCLIFFGFLVAMAYLCDWIITRALRRSHVGEFGIWTDIFSGNLQADVAIYGSSRAWVHINPQIIEDSLQCKAYNFGIDGHNFLMQYMRHRLYFQYNTYRPKIIVLSMEMSSLGKRQDLFGYEQFLPYLNEPLIWNACQQYNHPLTEADRYLPMTRYFGEQETLGIALRRLMGREQADRIKGFQGQEIYGEEEYNHRKTKYRNWYEQAIDVLTMDDLEQFLKDMQGMGIRVAMVFSPEQLEDHQVLNRAEMMAVFDELAKKNGAKLYDLAGDTAFADRSWFYDPLHLNAKGAEKFTKERVLPILRAEGMGSY